MPESGEKQDKKKRKTKNRNKIKPIDDVSKRNKNEIVHKNKKHKSKNERKN